MNEEVAGQLHSNTIAIQDAQASRIYELEQQVDGMGLIMHKTRKKVEALEVELGETKRLSVMCQALLTHYVESHWTPIGQLLEQIGSRSSCGLFPPAPHYCDLHDVDPVTPGETGSSSPTHWGRGPMETSDYIVNTLKTLVQFTQPFTTRYILETFQMLPYHLSNMCLQNNISNVSRILPQMFPTCTQKSHADQSEKNWAHAEHIYNVPM